MEKDMEAEAVAAQVQDPPEIPKTQSVQVAEVEGPKRKSTDSAAAEELSARESLESVVKKERGCCYRCCYSIFKFFANDRIYGSFVGPHPVSFLFCCCACCKGTCKRPFVLASIATKLMWFIMLIFIIMLSCFFIIPYGRALQSFQTNDTYPCNERKIRNNISGTCAEHGGYFMVYRNFLAYDLLLIGSGFIMINVKSTRRNYNRAKMHHGFWMYKYIILFVLLLVCYLATKDSLGGLFEYIMSWMGLAAVLLFSFVEITFILDILEFFSTSNRRSLSDWADFSYWALTIIALVFDIAMIVIFCMFYGKHQYRNRETNEDPSNKIEWSHVGIIIYAIVLMIALIGSGVVVAKRRTFKYTGVLQSAFVTLYVLTTIWVALGSSPKVTARMHFNVYGFRKKNRTELNAGNQDTFFKVEGCVHGLLSFFSLAYYVFWHGPRSTTAPLSILFDKVFYGKSVKKPEVPVIPPRKRKSKRSISFTEPNGKPETEGPTKEDSGSESKPTAANTVKRSSDPVPVILIEDPDGSIHAAEKAAQRLEELAFEYGEAIEKNRVWDDEKWGVRYSWSLFYLFMCFGSLSIMTGITAFSTPWALQLYASSYESMGVNLAKAFFVSVVYIGTTVYPCARVFPEPETLESSEDPEAPA